MLLFKTGKFILHGGVTWCKLSKMGRRYLRLLQKAGVTINNTRFKIVTMSALYTLRGPIDLNQFDSYNAELHNAALIRNNKIAFLVFTSGKIIITGIKNNNDIDNYVYPQLIELELYCK